MQVGVMLNGTAFDRAHSEYESVAAICYRRRTDEQGAFSFDPKPGAHTVVRGDRRLGRARFSMLRVRSRFQLQAWGRIEGIVRTLTDSGRSELHWLAPAT